MPSYEYRVFGFLELELGLVALVQKDARSPGSLGTQLRSVPPQPGWLGATRWPGAL
jgi:hypothetical protein